MNIRPFGGQGGLVNINKLSTENVDKVNKSLDNPVQTDGEKHKVRWNKRQADTDGGYLGENKSIISTGVENRGVMRLYAGKEKLFQHLYTGFYTGFPQVIHKLWKSG